MTISEQKELERQEARQKELMEQVRKLKPGKYVAKMAHYYKVTDVHIDGNMRIVTATFEGIGSAAIHGKAKPYHICELMPFGVKFNLIKSATPNDEG